MKKVFLFVLAVVIALTSTGCGNSVSQEEYDALKQANAELQSKNNELESTHDTDKAAKDLCDAFVQRYNKQIDKYNANLEISTDLQELGLNPLIKIEGLSSENPSFNPNTWTHVDIHLNDDATYKYIGFGARAKTFIETNSNFLETLELMGAVAYASNATMSEEESMDLSNSLVKEFITDNEKEHVYNILDNDEYTSSDKYESVVGSMRYVFSFEKGCLLMECIPE